MRSERGSGSMLALIGISLVVPFVVAGLSLSSLWLARERVAGAADLGALAGATAMVAGQNPCPAAGLIVEANGAVMTLCSVESRTVVVEAEKRVREPFGIEVPVTATSRAGSGTAK